MKIGISANSTKDIGFAATKECLDFLNEKGAECYLSRDIVDEFVSEVGIEVASLTRNAMMRDLDLVVIFGGDGTVLRFLDGVHSFNAAILAVNMGNLGYLTECDVTYYREALQSVLNGEYSTDKRFLLSATVENKTYFALNEVLLSRGTRLNTLPISVFLDGEYTQNFCGDGVMVSTPTGSTAYSLSAGGPILSPDVSAYLVTPVCPHSINVRPMVVSDKMTMKMFCTRKGASAHLYIDGKDKGPLPEGAELTVKKSPYEVGFVRINNVNFYTKIMQTLDKRR